MPQRKKKCPACRQSIFTKSTPEDRNKRLMTEAQPDEAERIWHAYHERQKALSVLQSFGIGEKDLLSAKQRSEESDAGAVVAILKRVAAEAVKLHERKMAFYCLATYAETDGLPFVQYLTEASRCEPETGSEVLAPPIRATMGSSGR